MQGDGLPRLVVHDHCVVAIHGNPELRCGNVNAEMLGEVCLRPESQAANSRVQAIRADHQIEPAGSRVVEDHIDTTSIGMKLGDHLIE
jgi:hypothetical protein